MAKRVRLIISLSVLFLATNLSYLYAQEKEAAREEARQYYREGKEFYSQGQYQEATVAFTKAITLVTPSQIQFQERVQKGYGGGPSQETGRGLDRATTLVTPSQIQFQERIQEGREAAWGPRPTLSESPESLSFKEKLAKKKEEEKKEEEKKKTGVSKRITTEAPAPETREREYYIDLGDILDISVWQTPDLSRSEVIVRPDGKVSFPLIGDIKAEGLTLTELDEVITEKLKAYLKTPEVSIMIRRFGEQTNKVVILGEIPAPGIYKFSGPPSITEAIASAGGYTRYAVLNSIMVIRGDIMTKPEVTRVNFAKIIKSGRLSENILLRPNDIVYVPKSFIGNINTFLEIFQPAISQYMQTLNARYLHNVVHRN